MSTCLVQWRDCDDGKELLFSLVANIVRQYLAWFQVWSFTFTLYKTCSINDYARLHFGPLR